MSGFCEQCVRETRLIGAGPTWRTNGCGWWLYGNSKLCPMCQSIVQRKWICIFWVPLIPLARYRVKYTGSDTYLSRRLLNPRLSDAEVAAQRADDAAARSHFEAVELWDHGRILERERRFEEALNVYEEVEKAYPETLGAQYAREAAERVRRKQ